MAVTLTSTSTTPTVGSTITVTAKGLEPGSPVCLLLLDSSGVEAWALQADKSGTAQLDLTLGSIAGAAQVEAKQIVHNRWRVLATLDLDVTS